MKLWFWQQIDKEVRRKFLENIRLTSGTLTALTGISLAGAESTNLTLQITINLTGLALFAIPLLAFNRKERQ